MCLTMRSHIVISTNKTKAMPKTIVFYKKKSVKREYTLHKYFNWVILNKKSFQYARISISSIGKREKIKRDKKGEIFESYENGKN